MCGQSSASSEWSRLKTPPLRKLLQDLMDVLLQARRPGGRVYWDNVNDCSAKGSLQILLYGFAPCQFLFYLIAQLTVRGIQCPLSGQPINMVFFGSETPFFLRTDLKFVKKNYTTAVLGQKFCTLKARYFKLFFIMVKHRKFQYR